MKKRFVLLSTMILLLVSALLAGCTAEFIDPLPQKVTIEKKEEPSASAESMENTSSDEASPTETPEAAPEPTEEPTPTPTPLLEAVSATDEERNGLTTEAKERVVAAANHRLDTGYYSRDSLISGLISDGFSPEQAEYGADHCYVTWY